MRKTSGYALGFMTDTHTGASAQLANAEAVAAWLWAKDPVPVACVFGGDLNIRDWATSLDFRDWLREINWPDSIEILPVIGNHDTLYSPTDGQSLFQGGQRPHDKIMGAYPDLFRERPYYTWQHENVQVVVGWNLMDDDEGNYGNCNGPDTEDWGGFNETGSAQQALLMDAMHSGHGWQIAALHRPIYSPFSDDPEEVGRPTLAAPRSGIVRRMIRAGLSMLWQGDQHIRFVGVKYRSPADDITGSGILYSSARRWVGATPVVMSGGYVTRAIDTSFLPGETEGTHYAYANGTASDTVATAMHCAFNGDSATITVAACSDGETVSEVYTGTVWRNIAGDMLTARRVQISVPRALRSFASTIGTAPNLLGESEVITAPAACDITIYRTGIISSGAGASANVTIGDGAGAVVGQRKLIEFADKVDESDVISLDHANIETSAGVQTTNVDLDDSGEFVLLEWTGAKWRIKYSAATVATA